MADMLGFWSYVHDDDQAEGGRITRLAKDLVDQFQMLTGEKVNVFLDKKDLLWGENWQEKIDTMLSTTAFFIPVITPRYFMSPACRSELQQFARQAKKSGIQELILPLIYVDFQAIHDETTSDDLIRLVRTFQWEDWSELRYLDVLSEGYRRGVSKLAKRLADANKHAEVVEIVGHEQIREMYEEINEESPGTIDLLATSEEMLEKLPGTLQSITQFINQISGISIDATDEIQRGNAQGKGYSARLVATRKAANKMNEPIEQIWKLSNDYTSQLHDVDTGFRIIIEQAQREVRDDPDSIVNFCKFFKSVHLLSESSNSAMDSLQGMIFSFEPLEQMSRDLRPVLRRLKSGLTNLIESTGVINEWIKMIEISNIECEE